MTLRHLALLVGLCLLTFFAALGTPRLWDRDEPRNARASVEMMSRGDWVVPTFNENGDGVITVPELRTHKPVLINWLMIAAYRVFDDPEFAARFWSAALGLGTVLMTYAIGRRLFNAPAAAWAGVVLATCLLFPMMARIATPEMPFVFFLTAAKLAYVYGAFRPKAGDDANGEIRSIALPEPRPYFPSLPVAALMYGLMGVAVLAKGPAGLVLPTAVIGMFLLVMRLPERTPGATVTASPWWRRWLRGAARTFAPAHLLRTAWSMRPITALLVAAAVALPWYALVWDRTDGAWVRGFIFEHNIGRAAKPMEGHGGSLLVYPLMVLLFYPVTIFGGFFPWSLLVVPICFELARRIRARDAWAPGYVFLVCWAGVYVVAFSLARTKLASYMTPMFPAAALMTGAFLHRWTRDQAAAPARSVIDALRLLPIVGAGAAVGVPIVAWFLLRGELWSGAIGLVPVAGGLAAMSFARREQRGRAAGALAVTAAALVTLVFTVLVVRIDRYQHSYPLLAFIDGRSDAPRIATYNRHEPSWVFYSGQQLENYKRAGDAAAFLARSRDAFVITSDKEIADLRRALPPGIDVLTETPYFGKSGDLLVIGHKGESQGPATQQVTRGGGGS